MIPLLWLVPALPLLAFLLLALFGRAFPRPLAAALGTGFLGLSALLAAAIAFEFFGQLHEHTAIAVPGPVWFSLEGFSASFSLHLDAVSMLFTLVVTWVGFLIFLFSTEYMAGDAGFSRFFAYMNLFAFSMLTLVLADNMVLLLLGWEGVGLCSYLLIGFWYDNPDNGNAARKAFITTRIGAVGLILATVLLFRATGTLHIPTLLAQAPSALPLGSLAASAVAFFLLVAALGKSAQVPLQVWLPDAMAGPTPTSALIHAATMVTAGVYLIARHHVLFEQAPVILGVVTTLGGLTLLIAGVTACFQRDIKRVLAYSTISQIGYMFFALGVGAWTAALFHFFTHAIFKALLFLGAGAIITALHHEQDMYKMGGLRKTLPGVFWPFLAGAASLAALPLVSSGFFSKDLILWQIFTSTLGHPALLGVGLLGALITAYYTGRMVLLTFFGEARTPIHHPPGLTMTGVLAVLAVASVLAGYLETPHTLGHITVFSHALQTALGEFSFVHKGLSEEILVQSASVALVLAGLGAAWWRYGRVPVTSAPALGMVGRFFFGGWDFDNAYSHFILRPYTALCRFNQLDIIDLGYRIFALIVRFFHLLLAKTQSGLLRHYGFGLAAGAGLLLLVILFL